VKSNSKGIPAITIRHACLGENLKLAKNPNIFFWHALHKHLTKALSCDIMLIHQFTGKNKDVKIFDCKEDYP